ncbi:hypothetical protein CcI49_22335 [Frankia sp. CcI49]|uniref:hypothetical protein n=1 Tax=unclassified Frankia TaxID=2632575 RepID=UPI0006CA2E5A|nr:MULTISPECIES: hypothetical protein [unclassified Frankia]KPM55904.1 hypothetical protein ACG83_11765 [Frankia sp. R43]ONH58232.1 hypothetical protein CcI49_22335 [Frankia sp. CcI49]
MATVAFVVACLAVVAAGFSAWYGRGQKRAADLAATEARRAADAAAEAVRIEQARRADEVADAEHRRVRFKLVPTGGQSGSLHLLRNTGTDTAYGVHIDTGDLRVANQTLDFDEIKADTEHTLYLARTMRTTTDRIEITWSRSPDHSASQRSVRLLVR